MRIEPADCQLRRGKTRWFGGGRGAPFRTNQEFGVRVNAAHHNGKTAIDDEKSKLSLVNVGLDWRNENARLSADLGWQATSSKPRVPMLPYRPDRRAGRA